MQTAQIHLGTFAAHHIDGAVALSRQAGWPHRAEDWAMLLGLSQGTVALDGARVVGTAMVTPYGDTASTINMVMVDVAMRGQGLGRRLMAHSLEIAAGRECRLIATQDGLPLYEKLGFRATGGIAQHQGVVLPGRVTDQETDWDGVTWCRPDQAAAFAAMDRAACGMDRSALIGDLFDAGRLASRQRDGRSVGFAALRRFGRGEVVGPVVAETADDARALLSFCFAARRGPFLRVDTPEASGLAPWLAARGLVAVGGGIAMRRDPCPDGPRHVQTFALASQALG
jgi:GNAT superfamily N-acetyltransferase